MSHIQITEDILLILYGTTSSAFLLWVIVRFKLWKTTVMITTLILLLLIFTPVSETLGKYVLEIFPKLIWLYGLCFLLLATIFTYPFINDSRGYRRILGFTLSKPKKVRPDFVKKALMTYPEKRFFRQLKEALPEYYVFTQVSFGAVLNPNYDKHTRAFWSFRGKFAQKIADFVICGDNLEIRCFVELDDTTHNPSKDVKRDAMLNQAGYEVIRWHRNNLPTISEIRERIVGFEPERGIGF